MQQASTGTRLARPAARSVGDEVAARLEKRIVLGDLKPGDRLPSERELAASLQVSRASLREAMHELEAKHLIERTPGRGTTVLPPPAHVSELYSKVSGKERELREVAELRDVVEPRLARFAALRATEADLIALREVLADTGVFHDPQTSLRLDLEFHLLVAQAADNGLLASLITLTASWTTKTRVLSHNTETARRRSHAGHCRILDAITSRNPDAASLAMTCHLDEVNELTRANVARQART